MKKLFIFGCLFLFFCNVAHGKDLRGFLRNCAWGALGGATVGVVSLAFTDKPSESWGNVAKGASLGLYAGIAYGVMSLNKQPESSVTSDYVVVPEIQQGQLAGVRFAATVYSF